MLQDSWWRCFRSSTGLGRAYELNFKRQWSDGWDSFGSWEQIVIPIVSYKLALLLV